MILFILVLLILALILIYAFIRNPSWLSPISIGLSGVERFSVYIGLTVTPIVFSSIFLIAAPVFIKPMREGFIQKLKHETVIRFLVSMLVAVAGVSFLTSLFSPYQIASIKGAVYVVLYLLLLLAEYILVTHIKNKVMIFWAITLSLLFFSLYALLQFILFSRGLYPDPINMAIAHSTSLSPLDFTRIIGGHELLRPNSGFNDVNSAAGFILVYLPFLGYLIYTKASGHVKLYVTAIVAGCLSLLAFISMSSRGGYLAIMPLVLLVLLYVVLRIGKYRIYMLMALMVLILSVGVVISTHLMFIGNDFQALYRSEYSTRAHIAYIDAALTEFHTYPLLGGGIDSYDLFFNNEMKSDKVGYYSSVDNPPLYIKYLAEEGIIGFMVNICLILFVLIRLFVSSIRAKSTDKSLLALSLASGFIALLSSNAFHAYFSLFFCAVFMGVALGIVELL